MMTAEIINAQWEQHKAAVTLALQHVSSSAMVEAATVLHNAAMHHYPIFVAGNGASAALSQHWACDHLKGSSGRAYSNHVVSLASNMSLVTAIGNDYGYDQVFTEQLKRHTRKFDHGVVVLISASGKSPNIVHTANFIRDERPHLLLISLTGFDGEPLRSCSNVNLHVPVHEYEAVEDVHNAIMHVLAKLLRVELT